jgi:hypothetical protein
MSTMWRQWRLNITKMNHVTRNKPLLVRPMRNQKRLNDIVDHFKYLNPQTREKSTQTCGWCYRMSPYLLGGFSTAFQLQSDSRWVRSTLVVALACFNVRVSAWTWPLSYSSRNYYSCTFSVIFYSVFGRFPITLYVTSFLLGNRTGTPITSPISISIIPCWCRVCVCVYSVS